MMNQNPKTKRKKRKKSNPRIRLFHLPALKQASPALRKAAMDHVNQTLIDEVTRVKRRMENEIQETENRLVLLKKDYQSFVRATRRVYG